MPNFGAFGNISQPMVTAGVGENGSINGVFYYSTTNVQLVRSKRIYSITIIKSGNSKQDGPHRPGFRGRASQYNAVLPQERYVKRWSDVKRL